MLITADDIKKISKSFKKEVFSWEEIKKALRVNNEYDDLALIVAINNAINLNYIAPVYSASKKLLYRKVFK